MAEGGQPTNKELADEHKKIGNKYLNELKFDAAIEEYTIAISLDPNSHVLFSNRSAAHGKTKNFTAALSDAEQVIKLRPDWPKGYYRKGTALKSLGRFDEAKDVFQEGSKIAPEDKTMEKELKECEAELDGPPPSQPLGNPFANLDPIMPLLRDDDRTRRFVKEDSYIAMLKDLGENPLNMSRYLKDERLRLTLSVLLGTDLQKPEDMDLDDDDEIVDPRPKSNDPELKDNDRPKITELPELATLKLTDKEKAEDEKKLGTTFLIANEYEQAHMHYDNAISLNPTDASLYSNKALVYSKQNLPLKVREFSQMVVEIAKEHGGHFKIVAKAHSRIGKTYYDEGSYEKALESFMKSNELNSNQPMMERIKQCEEILKQKNNNETQ